MPTIEVDGVRYEVREGANLLQACLSQGLDLPYFCWHPSLGSVGACRQCAVVQYKDEEDTQGKLTMACMTPAADGTRLSIDADEAVGFRASVIEWLMLNHPHDCPVCEEGGECHLQDMTVMTGHTVRRYRGRKRTFRNQYLGPLLNHEMNRCITCYRCVRFYRDYAGGRDFDAFGSRDRMYFGRAEDGVLESEFAGNLVEVCPTGVFTDKPFSRTYTRKWDLTSAPSICHGCGVGCNTLPGERYGALKRVHNRYHSEINGYFLCDRGRFGAGFVNADGRLHSAGLRRDDGSFDPVPPDEALRRAAAAMANGRVLGIGSPRASMESNFALASLVGREQFCSGFADYQAGLMAAVVEAMAGPAIHVPTLQDVEAADAVLVLGEDVANTAPRLALALRQSVRNESFAAAADASIPVWQDAGVRNHGAAYRSPLYQAAVLGTRLDDIAEASVCCPPETAAELGERVADQLGQRSGADTALSDDLRDFAAAAAQALGDAKRPLIISGTGSGSAAVIRAAAAVARALAGGERDVSLCLNVPECNSLGAHLLGGGMTLAEALTSLEQGEADTVIVLENELSRRAEAGRLTAAVERANVIVVDCQEGWTPEHADVVLPAATFAESDGTWVNYEGRAQRFYRVFPGRGDCAPAWQWLTRLARTAGQEFAERLAGFEHVADVTAALAREHAVFAEADDAAPEAGLPAGLRVPRQPHRYSGRTAMHAHVSVHEPRPPADTESPLAFSMEGQQPRDPGVLLPFSWAPGWNSNQSVYKFQAEAGGALRGGPAGVRLDVTRAAAGRRVEAPAAAADRPFRALPLQDVFASDELSLHAAAIRQRAAQPYAVLAPADAQGLGITAGSGVRVVSGGVTVSLAARIDPTMVSGAVGLVEGMTKGLFVEPGMGVDVSADPDYVPPSDGVIARG